MRSTTFEGPILRALARFRGTHPDLRLQISSEPSASLLRDLRRGDYDLVVAASDTEQPDNPSRRWLEPSGWGAASAAVVQGEGPVPLLVVGESSLSRRLSVSALERAGPGLPDRLCGAAASPAWSRPRRQGSASPAGRGAAWSRRACRCSKACRGCPRLPDVYGGVYLREGLDLPEVEELADMIAAAVGEGADAGYRDLARRRELLGD